jgi:hypothetical protein
MKDTGVKVTAEQVDRRKKIIKWLKIAALIVFLFLFGLYLVLSLVNNGGNFTVVLSNKLAKDNRLSIYETKEDFDFHRRLSAKGLDSMDNISIDWLPKDIDTEADGSHNGDNYIAYSFYVENRGESKVNYWEEVYIDDVLKNIDEAIRFMIIQNGVRTVYAKPNSTTGKAEEGTEKFYSKDKIIVRPRNDFAPGAVDRYTVVIWLEGSDEDCVNELIGGQIKMHMEITDEEAK